MDGRKFDGEWYIGVSVTSSLVLQTLLYLLAPLRKRSKSKSIHWLTSIVFFLTNWIPSCTLVIICSSAVIGHHDDTQNSPLLSWSSLMLLHIVGHGQERESPHSIQLRELIKESYQISIEFIFNTIIFLITLIFLYHASNYRNMMVTFTFVGLACRRTIFKLKDLQERRSEIKEGLSVTEWQFQIPMEESKTIKEKELGEEEVTSYASCTFKHSQRVIMGHSLKKSSSKHSYLNLSHIKACRIVEAELKLIYYKFYGGVVPNMFELVIVTALLALQLSYTPKAIFIIFFNYYLVLYISSMKNTLKFPLLLTAIGSLAISFSPFLKPNIHFSDIHVYLPITHQLVAYPIMLRLFFPRHQGHQWPKWSRTIPRFNLLAHSLEKPSKLSASVNYFLNSWSLTGKGMYEDEIGESIFKVLTEMIDEISQSPTSSSSSSSNGVWVLRKDRDFVDCETPFQERVILWHVATTILYNTQNDDYCHYNKYTSMLLSDYMGYLLIVQPWIMSKQRGVVLRRCFEMWTKIVELVNQSGKQGMQLKEICEQIKPINSIEQGHTRTVLHRACALVVKLESKYPDAKDKWDLIVKVWVEMLAYAAIRCKPINHIHGLSQGGELATIIWLWMVHFGFLETEKFQSTTAHYPNNTFTSKQTLRCKIRNKEIVFDYPLTNSENRTAKNKKP